MRNCCRVFITRRVIRDGSTYFGPYTSKARIKTILELIKQLFPLRTCNYKLSEENINAGKFKVCLEYHIKNCLGPCVGYESREDYDKKITQVKNILRGNFGAVKSHFKSEMERLAMELDFEQAHQIKEKLTAFEDYQAKSTVVSTKIQDVDVFSIASEEEEKEAYINYIKIVNGAIIHTHTQELIKNLDDEEQELLEYAIPIIRERFNSIAREIILPYELQLEDGLQAIIPKIGDKKKLLELSQKNARFFMLQRKKQRISHQNKQTSAERILRTLQSDLNMDQLPLHVECFDNSNIQGSHPVASCVVFKNAKPSKKDYRHFNIKTVVGPDDYASMEEVVYRRYRRLLAEKQALPQLVIIDGGKGQLSAAVKSIEKLGLTDQITVIGIAKRLEEIFFPGDAIPLYIDKKSESLKLIQQARNEAHRFAITFHRNQRSRNFTSTVLTKIPGVGHKTAQKLLAHFGSVKKIRQASIIDLSEVVGLGAAKKVNAFFSSAEEE
jgi:excinuclease ABC subunit C